ncbi:LysR family transcriptional regulator [Ligilactobacillus sp. WILCCON 0076]|uniref:LysR family transcriptional regulator n=1 Tax=Ligilactobacillus ubinensis TaxID=2876789 RepID=A0A9X2JLP5_9LACO|nr:LysR family transcriptional regulator [Ligilactobacillus ubinensis]MCP0887114.1 LysR family transcriptional regulator [Ligilactobacillus ubinensis]
MKLHDLAYFCSLYNLRTFTAVAKHFNVEQPTVTLAIKRLENSVQAKLVFRDRSKGMIQVTPAGEILYRHAVKMLEDANLAEIEIRQYANSKIRFGLPPIIGSLYFPKIINEITDAELLKNLEIDESGSQQLLTDLMTGKVDIALLATLLPVQNSNISVNFLGSRDFYIISATNHWLAQQEEIDFSELKNEPFITLNGKFIHQHLLKLYGHQAHFKPRVVFETQSISTLKKLVAKNAGIGLLVGDAVNSHDQLSLTKITPALPERFNISIATRKDYLFDEQEESFINKLLLLQDRINN